MAILSLRSSTLPDARRKFRKDTYAFAIALLVKVAPRTFITLRAVFFNRFPYLQSKRAMYDLYTDLIMRFFCFLKRRSLWN